MQVGVTTGFEKQHHRPVVKKGSLEPWQHIGKGVGRMTWFSLDPSRILLSYQPSKDSPSTEHMLLWLAESPCF